MSKVFAACQGVSITANAAMVRYERLEGRDYAVVPMVMLTEGVHKGSNGAMFYPKEEMSALPQAWNHKPIVVYHPTENGQGVSACSPKVVEAFKVGMIFNTKFDGRLPAEAWIDIALAEKVDRRVMQAVRNQKMLELSTGLYTVNDPTPGVWNGEAYTSVARQFSPDHLAILPDQVGACSVKDGAGFIRNHVLTSNAAPNISFVSLNQPSMNKAKIIAALTANAASGFLPADTAFLEARTDDQLKAIATTNGLTEDGTPVAKPAPVAPAAPVNTPAPLTNEEREALDYGKTKLAEDKAAAIATITANKANPFTEAELGSKSISELRKLAAFCPAPAAPNFGGQAPVGNSQHKQQALTPPGYVAPKK